jgi:uncharacterized protein (TIGR03083 family)
LPEHFSAPAVEVARKFAEPARNVSPMRFPSFLDALRHNGERLAAVAELGLDADVPSCPEWTVADLVAHTGAVHRQKEQIVREGWQEGHPPPVTAPDEGLIDWYREGLAALVDTLAEHDPAETVVTWYPPEQNVGFWYRRMAHETLIHRIDAELAHEVGTGVPADLAGDGVDEILTVMMTGHPEWAEVTDTGSTAHLAATDTGATWGLRLVTFSGTSPSSGVTFEDEPTFVFDVVPGPELVAAGTAEQLLRFLWGRGPADVLTVEGDPGLLDMVRSVAMDVTQ